MQEVCGSTKEINCDFVKTKYDFKKRKEFTNISFIFLKSK